MAIGEVDGVEAASQHSFCGLCYHGRIRFAEKQTGRIWMIVGQRSTGTGVGEKVEAAEGLYLSWGPRYSRQKMGSG
jgi:hypothetical protein